MKHQETEGTETPKKLRPEAKRILRLVHRLRVVNSELLSLWLGGNQAALARHLRALVRGGFVHRWHYGGRYGPRGDVEYGRPVSVYGISKKGLQAIGVWDGTWPAKSAEAQVALRRALRFAEEPPSQSHLQHTLGLTGLEVALERAALAEAKAERWWHVGFHRDDDPRRGGVVRIGPDPMPRERQESKWQILRPYDGGEEPIIADAHLELTRDAGTQAAETFGFVIELDRAREDLVRIERKFRRWWAYMTSDPIPGYRKADTRDPKKPKEPSYLAVLFVTETSSARRRLQMRLRQLVDWQRLDPPAGGEKAIPEPSGVFLFVSLDDLSEDDPGMLLRERIVQTGDGAWVALVPPRTVPVDDLA